jgi:hypothetical protein
VDGRSRRLVEVAERYADGVTTECGLLAAKRAANLAARGSASRTVCCIAIRNAWEAADWTLDSVGRAAADYVSRGWSEKLTRESAGLVREVFGNPFHPVAVDPAWLAWNGGTVRRVAQAIYDNRDFDHLPILADALEDAGCSDDHLLGHCHSEGPHVRGCWVVDLLLGRE